MSSFHTGALLCNSIRLSREWLCHLLSRLSCSCDTDKQECSWISCSGHFETQSVKLLKTKTDVWKSVQSKAPHDSRMLRLTFWGLTGTLSKFMFMPGMITVILRGPLKPSTLVSCQRVHRFQLFDFISECTGDVVCVVIHSHSRWQPVPVVWCSLPAAPRGFWRGCCRCRTRWIWCPWGWTWWNTNRWWNVDTISHLSTTGSFL